MRVTMAEWIDLQKKTIRACDGPENIIPKIIFIGKITAENMVEVKFKMVANKEWENFQKAWEQISGATTTEKNILPRPAPQFFLICN